MGFLGARVKSYRNIFSIALEIEIESYGIFYNKGVPFSQL